MTDELSTPDRVYFAIASLRGWDAVFELHRFHGAPQAWRVGRLASSILLAADDNRMPLAVAGKANDHGTGNIVVVYPDFLVAADVRSLDVDSGDFTVSVHALSDVTDLQIATEHSFYDGVEERARNKGIEVTFKLGGQTFTLTPTKFGAYGEDTLVGNTAIHNAYSAVRTSIVGTTTPR